MISTNVAWIEYLARRFSEAEQDAARARELGSTFYAIDWVLGMIHNQTRRHDAAIEDHSAPSRSRAGTSCSSPRSRTRTRLRERSRSQTHFSKKSFASLENVTCRRIPPLSSTPDWETKTPLAWLEKCFQERSAAMLFLRIEPMFDPLRSDPRFADLIRRVDAARR